METFYIDTPKVKDKPKPIFIEDLIPFGRDNAIKREKLLEKCIDNGLCHNDRRMRQLIERARLDSVILNLSNGDGYYRRTVKDVHELQRYIKQEKNRAISSFKSSKKATMLYEDYIKGRITE